MAAYTSPYGTVAGYSTADYQRRDAAYGAADATAEREGADYAASANQAAADRTNSLARTLASARSATPGGGIRMGVRRKGLTANDASSGLTAANAAGRVGRRKAELRANADTTLVAQQQQRQEQMRQEQRAQYQSNLASGNSLGMIQIW